MTTQQPQKVPSDVDLLYNNPKQLIVNYQPLIQKIVLQFKNKGFLTLHETEDLIQSINEELLISKIKVIQKQYNGTSYLATYFSKIVYNLCLERLRIHRRRKDFIDLQKREIVPSNPVDQTNDLIIDEEVKRLSIIMRLNFTNRMKLEICLLALNGWPFKEILLQYCGSLPRRYIERAEKIERQYNSLNKKDIYADLIFLFNYCEKKSIKADALRKWVDARINEIIKLMNNKLDDLNVSHYNHETIYLLFDKYFEKKYRQSEMRQIFPNRE